MYLCVCKSVNESQAREAVREGGCSMQHLRCKTGLGSKCGVCRKTTKAWLNKMNDAKSSQTV